MSGKSKLHIFALSFTLTLLSTAALAQAATAAPGSPGSGAASPNTNVPPGAKIGIINIQDAIIATNEGKKEYDMLQQQFAPKHAELKALNDDVENLKKQLQASGDKLNEDARGTQARSLETKQKSLQRNYEDAQNEFQQAEQEVVNRIGQKMLAVLEKYANANGYAVVLDVSNPQTPVLWAGPGSNITKELVDAYNAESPVTAPPTTPATKPAVPRPSGPATGRPPASNPPTMTPKKP